MSVSKRVLIETRNLTVGDGTVILSDVRKHVLRQSQEPDIERASDILHPSDMAKGDWCWRHDYYRIRGYPVDPKSQNPSFHMENVFEEGHEIHHKWQRWLWEMGTLYGVFYCQLCEQSWWDRSPKQCFYCNAPLRFLRYHEIPLYADHLHMGGKSDGGLMIEDQPFRLLEIKSVSLGTLRFEAPELYERYENNESLDKLWMEINRPFPSHVRQGLLYLYMAIRGSNSDIPVPHEMVFIYEWKPRQLVKEFVVAYSPRWVERMLSGAQMVTDALDIGRPPPRPSWAQDEQVRICRSCPYRALCWKLNHEQQHPSHPTPVATPVKRAAANVRRRALTKRAS